MKKTIACIMLIFIACIISLSPNVYATETANKEGNEVLKNNKIHKISMVYIKIFYMIMRL